MTCNYTTLSFEQKLQLVNTLHFMRADLRKKSKKKKLLKKATKKRRRKPVFFNSTIERMFYEMSKEAQDFITSGGKC